MAASREHCERLCESLGVRPSPTVLKVLQRCSNDAEREAVLRESYPQASRRPGRGRDLDSFLRRVKR